MTKSNVIVIAPVITEKAGAMKEEKKYMFKVAVSSNKIEIKKAIEDMYKVKVDKVNVMNMNPKYKRVRMKYGYTDAWKKAVVTLKEGEIDVYKA